MKAEGTEAAGRKQKAVKTAERAKPAPPPSVGRERVRKRLMGKELQVLRRVQRVRKLMKEKALDRHTLLEIFGKGRRGDTVADLSDKLASYTRK